MSSGLEEQSHVVPGQLWRDNDPREQRTVTIIAVGPKKASVRRGMFGRITEVRLDRFHRDQKPRRTGFTLIQAARADGGKAGE